MAFQEFPRIYGANCATLECSILWRCDNSSAGKFLRDATLRRHTHKRKLPILRETANHKRCVVSATAQFIAQQDCCITSKAPIVNDLISIYENDI